MVHTLRIEIIEYNKKLNVCKGRLLNGDIVTVDPFCGCAIPLSDEDYKNGKAGDIVGNVYLLVDFHVGRDCITPYENGMILL